jgi:hypothetical protein
MAIWPSVETLFSITPLYDVASTFNLSLGDGIVLARNAMKMASQTKAYKMAREKVAKETHADLRMGGRVESQASSK